MARSQSYPGMININLKSLRKVRFRFGAQRRAREVAAGAKVSSAKSNRIVGSLLPSTLFNRFCVLFFLLRDHQLETALKLGQA